MIEAAIVDASVVVKWVVKETDSEKARTLSRLKLEAPDLLLIECANILWKKVRLGDLTRREAGASLDLLRQAPVTLTPGPELASAALDLSFDMQHPVYDCVYLALAARKGIPLVTSDRRLVDAIRKHRKYTSLVMLLSTWPG